MPNWCSNTLIIEGPEADIAAIKKKLAEPYGSESTDFATGMSVTTTIQNDLLLMNMRKPWNTPEEEATYRVGDNWYDLNVENWGTKWEVDGELNEDASTPTLLHYTFDSAWSPPEIAIVACAEQWPSLTFTHTYDEPGNGFAGRKIYAGGELVESEEGESRSFWCSVCDEGTYCEWGEPLGCQYADGSFPSVSALMHALADSEGHLDTVMWALTGALGDIDAGVEHLDPWRVDGIAAAIAGSPLTGAPPKREAFMVRVSSEVEEVPAWLAGALLTDLPAEKIEELAHHRDTGVAEIVSVGVAEHLR